MAKGLPSSDDIKEELLENSETHKNVQQEFIYTTADKLQIEAGRFRESLVGRDDPARYAAIGVALFTPVLAADFRKFLSLSPDTWTAIFLVFGALSLAAFLKSGWGALMGDKISIEEFIENVKRASSKEGVPVSAGSGDVIVTGAAYDTLEEDSDGGNGGESAAGDSSG